MREIILNNLHDAAQLEKLYRSNSSTFKETFLLLYPEIKDEKLAQYWNARLAYDKSEISWGKKSDWIFVIVASLLAGLIAKSPAIFNIKPEFFHSHPFSSYFFLVKND